MLRVTLYDKPVSAAVPTALVTMGSVVSAPCASSMEALAAVCVPENATTVVEVPVEVATPTACEMRRRGDAAVPNVIEPAPGMVHVGIWLLVIDTMLSGADALLLMIPRMYTRPAVKVADGSV